MAHQRTYVLLVAVLLLLGVSAMTVAADTPDPLSSTPIPASDCSLINPEPTITSCAEFPQPSSNLYSSLPWSVPAYQACVKDRCVCTKMKDTTDFTPSGYLCDASGWKEDGVFTCNDLMQCFSTFWECVTDALVDRYHAGESDAAEKALMEDQLKHGTTPGQKFSETETYLSCSQIICESAASRGNCGLLTCLPNFTQCYEFIRPPVLPYNHQLCTQGCRAVLTVMAVTIFTLFMAFLCCGVCPARVRVVEPLMTKDDDDDELGREKKGSSGTRSHDAASHASGANEPQARDVPEEKQAADDDSDEL